MGNTSMFTVRVHRFDPPRFRDGAPARYLLHFDEVADADAIAVYTDAQPGESFLLYDRVRAEHLVCVRQGPLSAGVGAKLATDVEIEEVGA